MRKDEFPIVEKFAKDKVKEVLNKVVEDIEELDGDESFWNGVYAVKRIIQKYWRKADEE